MPSSKAVSPSQWPGADGHRARLSLDASCRNLAVIATTGAGKTASFILPNLLSQDDGFIMATDPAGTLYTRTSGDLQRRGYKVHLSIDTSK